MKATALTETLTYILSLHRVLCTTVMSTNMSQVSVALFPFSLSSIYFLFDTRLIFHLELVIKYLILLYTGKNQINKDQITLCLDYILYMSNASCFHCMHDSSYLFIMIFSQNPLVNILIVKYCMESKFILHYFPSQQETE